MVCNDGMNQYAVSGNAINCISAYRYGIFRIDLVASHGSASRRHLFSDTAFFEELLLFLLEPTPHAAIRLMNERQRHITELFFAPPLEIRSIVFRLMMMVAELYHLLITRMGFIPYRPTVRTESIFVILAKLNEAASRRIDQFDFHFQTRHSICVPLGDVLLSATSGLLHLIFGAVAHTEFGFLEPIGHIVDHLRLLVEDEVSVIASAIQKSAFIELCHNLSILYD